MLLAFDYDGTLAPIVQRPEDAALRPLTRALLAELVQRYPCAVVSGRGRADVLRFLGGLRFLRVVGNHGLEWDRRPMPFSRRTIVRWREALRRACVDLPGVTIEDKTWSLAVHFRASKKRAVAEQRVLALAKELTGARVVPGKAVVNLVHEHAADKGTALAEIRRQLRCTEALYVGDDVTDEDAFALEGVLAVRVGKSPRSHARAYLRTQRDVDELLALLVSLRPEQRILDVAPAP